MALAMLQAVILDPKFLLLAIPHASPVIPCILIALFDPSLLSFRRNIDLQI
jgi:hypothetical protein